MPAPAGEPLIEPAARDDLAAVRELFRHYADSLPFSLEYQGFRAELDGLPAPYVPPDGCLFLARQDRGAVGVVGLKPLLPGIAEIKRLYVVPQARRGGLGRRLAERAIEEARARDYRFVRLDTQRRSMAAAMALYRRLGFAEIAPYGPNPGGGFAFFEKRL